MYFQTYRAARVRASIVDYGHISDLARAIEIDATAGGLAGRRFYHMARY